MKRLRPLLNALLGLVFCVQGLAIAAAPIDLPAAATDGAMEMPCHDGAGLAPCDCCGSACPDMAGCVIGHFFAAAAAAPAPLAPAAHAPIATDGWSPKTAAPSLPVRPPIVFHA
jgi:hypothetical protein